MGTTPKWERGSHLEISTDEKLDYLYTRDDAQQEQIDELIEGGSDLPDVTSSDNGDVLTVVDGAWAKAAPSGGSDLPDVTSADNGDVLTVVDGAWAKAAPSGGGAENYYVDFTATYNSDQNTYTITSNETGSTIAAAINSGKNIVGRINWPTDECQYVYATGYEVRATPGDEAYGFTFDFVDYSLISLVHCYISWWFRSGGRWESEVSLYRLSQST